MIGCGNHGCIIKPPEKRSLATNGGCNCLSELSTENRIALLNKIFRMERKIESALEAAETYPKDEFICKILR